MTRRIRYSVAMSLDGFIAKEDGGDCVMPSVQSASDGSYPIARPLFMYTDGEPTGATPGRVVGGPGWKGRAD